MVPCLEGFVCRIDFSIYANISYMKDFLNTTNTVPKKTARRARLWVFWQLYLFKINQVLIFFFPKKKIPFVQ